MHPIGILTRDRISYLDVTLKSLSAASSVPDRNPLVVFDDASVLPETDRYYHTAASVVTERKWPRWHSSLGIDPVIATAGGLQGIAGRIRVHRLSDSPLGVVNASCQAIQQLFSKYPSAPGVFLFQDDVIVNGDFYTRMVETAQDRTLYDGKDLGLLAGVKLNHRVRFTGEPTPVVATGITAQCLYIPKRAYHVLLPSYIGTRHKITTRFDDTFRRAIASAGLWAGTIYPYCCQHIGAVSIVRPEKRWNVGTKGRIGFYSAPPYAIRPTVRAFPG